MIDETDYGDIATNMSFGKGSSKCHGSTDIALTASGDIALTMDAYSNLRQRLMMWISTPTGERLSPDLGCCIYDFFFEKDIPENLRLFELTMENDLRTTFPTLDLKGVRITGSGDDSVGRVTSIKIILGDEDLEFLVTSNDLQDAAKQYNDVYKIF